MLRLAKKHGVTAKMIAMDTGYSRTAVGEWERGETCMSAPALLALAEMREFPSELLSLILEGTGRCIVDGDDDNELDTLGEDADAVAAEVRRARHPASGGGPEITDIEEARIRRAAAKLKRRVA